MSMSTVAAGSPALREATQAGPALWTGTVSPAAPETVEVVSR
ncbi:hypothetical protein ACFVAO_11880 [Streptomyces californicus]